MEKSTNNNEVSTAIQTSTSEIKKVEITNSFTYLGAVVTVEQKFDMELETRPQKPSTCYETSYGIGKLSPSMPN